jgi:hypothetical protein
MSNYDTLVTWIGESGIERQEAEHAIRSCALAMAKDGVKVYAAAGVIAYFMNATPATAIGYAAGGAFVGSAYAISKAPDCAAIRQRITFWNSQSFSDNP